MRVQPDVGKGQLKVTVGCHEKTDVMWMDLADLVNATAVDPGYAF